MARDKFSRMLSLAGALVLGLALSACQTAEGYRLSQTSAQGWGQIAAGAGAVISDTKAGQKADAKVAKASTQVAQYCGGLQTVATGATIFSPEKYQKAADVAAIAISRYCQSPPQTVGELLSLAAAVVKAYSEATAIRDGV